MNKSISILLLILMLSQMFDRVWIIIAFQFNQKYISENFCVQKDQAENTCQGKCHLQKQMQAKEAQEDKQFPQNLKNTFEVIYYTENQDLQIRRNNPITLSKVLNGFYQHSKPYSSFQEIFHPPPFYI